MRLAVQAGVDLAGEAGAEAAEGAARFVDDVRRNASVAALLDRLPAFRLPQAALVAGALFQTAWNLQWARAPTDSIRDYDVFYFDADDLSAAAEARVNAQLNAACADLGVTIEACNQARVHQWYEAHFGHPYAPLASVDEGISRFLVRCTCVGLQPTPGAGAPRLIAPHGLADLYAGRLERNAPFAPAALFRRKAESYRARWPQLVVESE
jgi:hypothetical protein